MGNRNIPLTSVNRSFRPKINKKTLALNDTLVKDLYRIFHPKPGEYTFFSNANGTFSRIDHMLQTCGG